MKTNKKLFDLSGSAAEAVFDNPAADVFVPTEKTRRILCILRILLRLIRMLLGKTEKKKKTADPVETGRGKSEE